MKFIHAADLHLDSPFLGLQNHTMPTELWNRVRESTFSSFNRLVNDAIEQQVDFVLLVGDLFDRNDHSVYAETFFIEQLNRLDKAGIPVLISFGNHDYFSGDVSQLGYPQNTFVFPNHAATTKLTLKDGQRVAISGFSFDKQWIREPVIQDYPQRATDVNWHIGMLHGSLAASKSPEANYAPFSVGQLEAKDYDYWALGHIHKRQSLNSMGTINYSGNTQGRHINEPGEKGYLLVATDHQALTTKFIPTAEIIWQTLQLPVSQARAGALADVVFKQLTTRDFKQLAFIRVVLVSDQPASADVLKAVSDGSLLATLQNMNSRNWQSLNCWLTSVKIHQSQPAIISHLDQQYFEEVKQATFTSGQLKELAGSLKTTSFIHDDLEMTDTAADIFDRAMAILQENSQREAGDTSC